MKPTPRTVLTKGLIFTRRNRAALERAIATSKRTRARRWAAALLAALLLVSGARTGAQEHNAPLNVVRSTTLDRALLVLPADVSAPGEAIVDYLRLQVAIEDGFLVYRILHGGVTRTLHVALDAPRPYAAFDPERNRFETLSPSVRVELEDYELLDRIIAAVDGVGGKAYPMLGFAIVELALDANPLDAVHVIETLPGVVDVRLMIEGPHRVPR